MNNLTQDEDRSQNDAGLAGEMPTAEGERKNLAARVARINSRFSNGAALSRDDIRDRPHWGFALLALCLVIAGLMYFQADRGRMHAPDLERVMPY